MSDLEVRAATGWSQQATASLRALLGQLGENAANSVSRFDHVFARKLTAMICETGGFGKPLPQHPWAKKGAIKTNKKDR